MVLLGGIDGVVLLGWYCWSGIVGVVLFGWYFWGGIVGGANGEKWGKMGKIANPKMLSPFFPICLSHFKEN